MSIFIPSVIKNLADEIRRMPEDPKWHDEIGKRNSISVPVLDPYKPVRCEGEIYQALLKLFEKTMEFANVAQTEIDVMLLAPNLQTTLCAVQRAIAFGMYGVAYEILRDARIRHLDAERASFFLYFCSRGTDYSIKALIFRSCTASPLACSDFPKKYPDFFWQYLSGDNDLDSFSIRWNPSGYLQYLVLMHAWAKEINCNADDIELFLCSVSEKFSNKDDLQTTSDLLNI